MGGDHARPLLDAEAALRRRWRALSKLDVPISDCGAGGLTATDVEALMRDISPDSETAALAPRHWLSERLWSDLARWFEESGDEDQALKMLRWRLDYQRQICTWQSCTLAWTLEGHARLLMSRFFEVSFASGRGSKRKKRTGCRPAEQPVGKSANGKHHDAEDVDTLLRIAAHAVFSLEQASGILQSMFGESHKYVASVERKHTKAKELYSKILAGDVEMTSDIPERASKRAKKCDAA